MQSMGKKVAAMYCCSQLCITSRENIVCEKDNYSSDKDVLSDRKCHLYLLLFVLVMVQILFSLFCEKPFLYQRQIQGLHIRRHLAKLLYLTYKTLHRFC